MALAAAMPHLPKMGLRARCCEDTLGMPRPQRLASDSAGLLNLFPEKTPIVGPPVPRPRRIILVRHGQSEGNVDESMYTRIPDPRIGLTAKGWEDAEACGRRIRELILSDGADDWKVYFYVSPYKRTLETLRGIGKAFEHERIAGVREEPRLREQDFGNIAYPPLLPAPSKSRSAPIDFERTKFPSIVLPLSPESWFRCSLWHYAQHKHHDDQVLLHALPAENLSRH